MDDILNGVIESVKLGITHGMLVGCIFVKHTSGTQGYITHRLEHYDNFDSLSIVKILNAVGVNSWEDLKGKPVRVYGNATHLKAIGHYMESKWFSYDKDIKEYLDMGDF